MTRWIWDRANFEPVPGNSRSSRKIKKSRRRKRGGRPRESGESFGDMALPVYICFLLYSFRHPS